MSDSDITRTCSKCGEPLVQKATETNASFSRRKTCGCKKTKAGLKPTENKQHLSRYGGGYVTNSQFLAEVMCERRAAAEHRQLPLRFWDQGNDAKYFMQQMRVANVLILRFGFDVVFSGINLPESKKAYSLSAAWLLPIINKEFERVAKLQAPKPEPETKCEPEQVVRPAISYTPPPLNSPAKNILARLRGPNGKKEG